MLSAVRSGVHGVIEDEKVGVDWVDRAAGPEGSVVEREALDDGAHLQPIEQPGATTREDRIEVEFDGLVGWQRDDHPIGLDDGVLGDDAYAIVAVDDVVHLAVEQHPVSEPLSQPVAHGCETFDNSERMATSIGVEHRVEAARGLHRVQEEQHRQVFGFKRVLGADHLIEDVLQVQRVEVLAFPLFERDRVERNRVGGHIEIGGVHRCCEGFEFGGEPLPLSTSQTRHGVERVG